MAGSAHMIRRQLVEVEVDDEEVATRVLDELSRLQATVIAPLLDRLCSAQDDPGSVTRIDRLEVDLGLLPEAGLEAAIATELTARLPMALSAALDQGRSGREGNGSAGGTSHGPAAMTAGADVDDGELPSVTRQLEMLTSFARTGMLPWWVDGGAAQPLEQGMEDLLERAPDALVELMWWARSDARWLRRVAAVASDAVRVELIDRLLSARFPSLSAGTVEL